MVYQTKAISDIYKNNTDADKVGNEVSSWFCIKLGYKQGCVLFRFNMEYIDGSCLKEHRKGNGRPVNQMGWKNYPGLRF